MYEPQMYQMPWSPQMQPMRQQWSQQPQQSGPDWIQVQSIKQVDQVSVQPGGKAWIMVQNEPIFALRTADQMGLATTAYYRFERYDPEIAAPKESEYVTRKEFEEFVSNLTGAKPRAKKEVAE